MNERIIELAANMSALKAEGIVSNGLTEISDDTILRMLKKQVINRTLLKTVCIDDFATRKEPHI
ncbi:hypothetical protein [Mesotoga sp.]|uniref:hypothetical protein n=1 Tax=Mesotoga sp. TaxID=2053577 RepID=UPI00345EB9BF